MDKTLKCDHSKESYCAVLSCGAIYYVVQGGSNCQSISDPWMIPYSVTIQRKATEQYFHVELLLHVTLSKLALTLFKSVDDATLVCCNMHKSYY